MRSFIETPFVHPTRLVRSSPRVAPLRHGASVDVDAWGSARVESRQRMRAIAVRDAARGYAALSDATAVAAHGLPLLGRPDDRVHTTPLSANPPKTHGDVIRHKRDLRADDLTLIDGYLVTSLDRTVFDAIRIRRLDAALAVMDAALHAVSWNPTTRDVAIDDAEGFRALVAARVGRGRGARGIRTARAVVELGDARVQSPGESRSRAAMWSNGMPMPELQVPVATSLGPCFLDFAWPELGVFGEFDGEVKLTDAAMRGDRSAAEVLEAQRARMLAVTEATGWRGMHWGWADAANAGTLWHVMVAQGWDPRWRI